MRRASALIVALWVIAVLSVMVLSFAVEAKLQTGINVYMRERSRVNRLVEAGRVLGEVVLAGYADAVEYSEDENLEDLLEEDRWVLEKRALKFDSKCTIGPILLDADHPESGTVTVNIELVNAGEKNAINLNELFSGGDKNYYLRWQLILRNYCGIPEDFEVKATDAHYKGESSVRLTDLLIASWNDWRDEDDTPTSGEGGDECGAESEWYEEYYDDMKADDEDRKFPRNGAVPSASELGLVRGFIDYPAVLTGGVVNPDEKSKEDQISVKGIIDLFGVTGSAKLNVNNCTVEQLLTIPGIGNEEDDDAEDAKELAEAIVSTLKVQPDYDVDEERTWWPYKDWDDLTQRVSDECDIEIGNEAAEYLVYGPDQASVFKISILGESMGMKHEVHAQGYVKDKKVRYIEWRED